mmetsp:Transcript_11675/g.21117  ORF Transcript_11675/g.21117 Transcript_11675/m.21117 type:complete len:92 (-) Transcript_11675:16-291(-)
MLISALNSGTQNSLTFLSSFLNDIQAHTFFSTLIVAVLSQHLRSVQHTPLYSAAVAAIHLGECLPGLAAGALGHDGEVPELIGSWVQIVRP